MKKIDLPRVSVLTSPNPLALVCSRKSDGTTNLAAVSWWMYLSYAPEMIAFAMAKTSYSGEMVRKNKKVILALPGEKIAREAMACGMSSGRDTDKIKKLALEMQALPGADILLPLHSRAAIQCRLKEYCETGDHYLYICEVEQVYGNENEEAVFAWNGYAELRPAKAG